MMFLYIERMPYTFYVSCLWFYSAFICETASLEYGNSAAGRKRWICRIVTYAWTTLIALPFTATYLHVVSSRESFLGCWKMAAVNVHNCSWSFSITVFFSFLECSVWWVRPKRCGLKSEMNSLGYNGFCYMRKEKF